MRTAPTARQAVISTAEGSVPHCSMCTERRVVVRTPAVCIAAVSAVGSEERVGKGRNVASVPRIFGALVPMAVMLSFDPPPPLAMRSCVCVERWALGGRCETGAEPRLGQWPWQASGSCQREADEGCVVAFLRRRQAGRAFFRFFHVLCVWAEGDDAMEHRSIFAMCALSSDTQVGGHLSKRARRRAPAARRVPLGVH